MKTPTVATLSVSQKYFYKPNQTNQSILNFTTSMIREPNNDKMITPPMMPPPNL
jgi:hypothetical protein